MTALVAYSRRSRPRLGEREPERERSDRRRRPASERPPSLFDAPSTEPTLDMVVSGLWEGLATRAQVACPLCGGSMVAVYGAHSRPVEGRCADCGSTLG